MENFYELLDGIEKNIEEHRTLALRLTQDHESYTNVLKTVETSLLEDENEALSDVDKEEIQAVLCRLHTRLHSVSIRLVTHRNESQTKAVEQVNQKLDDLVAMIETGSDDAPKIAESYMNACSNGIGSKFEALLLSCTSDDQKAAKERIKTIMDNMNAIKDGDDNDKKEQSTENSNM